MKIVSLLFLLLLSLSGQADDGSEAISNLQVELRRYAELHQQYSKLAKVYRTSVGSLLSSEEMQACMEEGRTTRLFTNACSEAKSKVSSTYGFYDLIITKMGKKSFDQLLKVQRSGIRLLKIDPTLEMLNNGLQRLLNLVNLAAVQETQIGYKYIAIGYCIHSEFSVNPWADSKEDVLCQRTIIQDSSPVFKQWQKTNSDISALIKVIELELKQF